VERSRRSKPTRYPLEDINISHCDYWDLRTVFRKFLQVDLARRRKPATGNPCSRTVTALALGSQANALEPNIYSYLWLPMPKAGSKPKNHAFCAGGLACLTLTQHNMSRRKAKARVQKIHYRIANVRADFLRKATAIISENQALVVMED
jgi:hypothetical protein